MVLTVEGLIQLNSMTHSAVVVLLHTRKRERERAIHICTDMHKEHRLVIESYMHFGVNTPCDGTILMYTDLTELAIPLRARISDSALEP